jgi:2-methylcitrate dehydratase PrpD
MDAIFDFVKHFNRVKYEDLSTAAVDAVKNEVLDSLATAIGGWSKAGIKELVDLIKEWGGTEQSSVIAYGIKCPTPNAAQINGSMIHALDYDDGNPNALVHVGCVTVSTCFAIAERVGNISGKEMITAIALGADFMSRLSLASRPGSSLMMSGWHPTAVYGYLGAAGIAGRILGLDEEKMANAFGIAYHQCAGNMQCIHDGALTKRMGPGLAAKGGITAALMAEKGITGAENILEGLAGLFNVYHFGDYDAGILTADLGKRFEVENLGFKPYPCCGHTHAHIDASLSLIANHNIKPDQINEVTAFCGESAHVLCIPEERKRAPRNIVDAQFSVPWAVATALNKGKVTLEDFTEEAIQNKDVLEISQKVIGKLDPAMNRHGVGPGKVTLMMKDGKEYTEEVEYCLGSVENPMNFEDCAKKFRECSAYYKQPLSSDKVEEVIEQIGRLEQLPDATQIIKLLT